MKKKIFGFALIFIACNAIGQNSKPFVIGTIEEIQSVILNEKRVLNIYLPEAYQSGDTSRYDVSYLLDGSADEDFIHIAGLYQYSSFEWVARSRKTIVVGIATVDRRRDFTFPTTIENDRKRYPTSGHSDLFMDFIEKEVQPYIERKYKTTASKTIIGQSLGALFATEVLFKRPFLFNKYIIISPSLWWDNGSLLEMKTPLSDTSSNLNLSIYIGVGKEGLAPCELPRVMEVDANLLAEKIKTAAGSGIKIWFDYLPAEDHATVFHPAVYNALKLMAEPH